MKGQKYGMTEDDWVLARERGLSEITVMQRLLKSKGDKKKALTPKRQGKRNQLEDLGRSRGVRLPRKYDQKLIELSENSDQTISDLIAKAVIKYLGD